MKKNQLNISHKKQIIVTWRVCAKQAFAPAWIDFSIQLKPICDH